MKSALILSVLLLGLLVIAVMAQANTAMAATPKLPPTVTAEQMPFFGQMQTRIAEYDASGDWAKKIFPADAFCLFFANSPIYIEVYVSDVEEAMRLLGDNSTADAGKSFPIYRPTEQAVAELSAVPHTYFYASKFSPSICLTVEKQTLQQIAQIPSVYCIRIIPSQAMTFNNLSSAGNFMLWIVLPLLAACIVLVAVIWARKTHKRRQLLESSSTSLATCSTM
jgi:hypothetical protein